MKKELEKIYIPQDIESKIYRRWEKSGYFNPDNLPGKRSKTFSIAMPPPNVTGELHLGHATTLTIEDLLTRYHRMQGYKTLYLPGTDHAGIATQIVVEKLIKKAGLNRHKLGRDVFVKKVWEWKKKYGSKITKQIRQLGTSCDWSREHFTMDQSMTKAVQEAFLKLYDDGLIYRGNRIVNWCPRCSSALSDLEVKHQETTGKLWFIKYPLFGSTKYLVVATTRPETMLGDTAVAVNPKDKRYKKYIGQKVILPLMNREIPIIGDIRVDQDYGTGAVKVTPAHDHFDYEIGETHKLNIINVIGQDSKMTKDAGEFYGLNVQQTRQEIIHRLEKEGLLEKTENHTYNSSRCDRCNSPIEPLISKQWFIKIKPLAKMAIAAVKKGDIKIVPDRFEKVYFHWMNNIKDWCISRQLWWGHQIPVWYKNGKIKVSVDSPGQGWQQDEDTLDTWFSSGLWTFSTLGWPENTKDLKMYHPTSIMETGWDILFFWVARMIMMSLYFKKEVPFKTVYLHGMVLDRHGQKMSKSKGTGVDPIPMTEKYGTDAIRLSLVLGTAAGQDYRLYEEKIAGYRNFVNKLWNVSRYILSQNLTPDKKIVPTSIADKWIISRLQKLIKKVSGDLNKYKFSDAGTSIYDFLWHEFADWYIEASKINNNFTILHYVLENILILSHPFIPFVTEEIWSRMRDDNIEDMLIIKSWPKLNNKQIDDQSEKLFSVIQAFVIQLRNFASKENITGKNKINVYYWGKSSNFIRKNADLIIQLARLGNLINEKKDSITSSLPGIDYYIDFEQDQDVKNIEIKRLSRHIQLIEKKLSNKNFVGNAPKEIVAKENQKLKLQQEKLKKLL